MLTEEQNNLVGEFRHLTAEKKKLDARLDEVKAQLRATMFADAKVGTNRVELGRGWNLKAAITETFMLDKDTDKVKEVLAELEDHIAAKLVKWKPTISKTAYEMLSDHDKNMVNKVLTTRENKPTFTIEEPKEEK